MEDDARELARRCTKTYFYPRPPGGGRQSQLDVTDLEIFISIHALRVEGDDADKNPENYPPEIFIHALRVEGDVKFPMFSRHFT